MNMLGLPMLRPAATLVPLVLRLGVGVVFIVHGYGKLTAGPTQFGEMLTGLGVPAPDLFAWLVTIAELVGGILLVVGLLTRLATLPLITTLIGAILLVKVDVGIVAGMGSGPGAEIDIALLAGLIALLLTGPGAVSLDRVLGIEKPITFAPGVSHRV